MLDAAATTTDDRNVLVRRAAVAVLASSGPRLRLRELAPLTDDPVRAMRIDTTQTLSALPESGVPEQRLAAARRARDDRLTAHAFDADRPESCLKLRTYYVEHCE